MFYLQTQAPAGNWVDNLGSENKQLCIIHGKLLTSDYDKVCRIVQRVDVVVYEFPTK